MTKYYIEKISNDNEFFEGIEGLEVLTMEAENNIKFIQGAFKVDDFDKYFNALYIYLDDTNDLLGEEESFEDFLKCYERYELEYKFCTSDKNDFELVREATEQEVEAHKKAIRDYFLSKYRLSDFIKYDKLMLKDNDLIVLQKDYFGSYRTCDASKCDELKKLLNLKNDLIACCYFCKFKNDCADCCDLDSPVDDGFFFDDKDDIVRCSYERFFEADEIEE